MGAGASSRPSLGDLAAATPASRDRVVDFVRAASIVLVVLGHWLVATVVRHDGDLVGANALVDLPGLRPATWLFQVMPVFFVVGGFANARSLSSAGSTTAGYLVRRLDRLLRPTLLFTGAWLVAAAALAATPVADRTLAEVTKVAAQPLWFLAVYVLIVLLAPVQLSLHRRHPRMAVLLLPAIVATLDVVAFVDLATDAALANYVLVFLFAQELGFVYADGGAARFCSRSIVLVAASAAAALVALTTLGPYPVSMVGVTGEAMSNMSPPSLCIVVLTLLQACLLLLAHPVLERWLERPRPWRLTILVNGVVLTLFLWHLTAFIVASAVLVGAGMALAAVGTWAWWGQKALWILTSSAVLTGLVAAASPIERRSGRSPRRAPPPLWLLVLGAVLAARGLASLAWSGFDDILTPAGRAVLGMQLSPLVATVLIAAGWLLTRLPARATGSTDRHRATLGR